MDWLSSLGAFGNVLRFIILIFEVLVVFNLMILVHEWGHFLAARWRGLKIEKFYIWFGKPIWKKKINGVEYGLGSIPMGGFVALPQMAPMETIEGASDEPREKLPPITPLDKIIVAFAGPLFSFMLAVFFAFLVSMIGKPQSESLSTTYIGRVAPESPAAKAGLKVGDRIVTIDGHAVKRFEGLVDSVRWGVVSSEGTMIHFEVERAGEGIKNIDVAAERPQEEPEKTGGWWRWIFKRPPLRDVGLMGRQTPLVGEVQANSPAELAGIKKNDLVLKVDGTELMSEGSLGDYIKANPDKAITLTIERAGRIVETQVMPAFPDVRPEEMEKRRMVGIVWDLEGKRTLTYPGVWEQVSDSVKHMVNLFQKLVSPKSDLSPAHMSGPVGIFRLYYTLFQHPDGWRMVVWFSVLFNINLALLNMLPFPVLDGGHIVMAIGEAIRKKPLQGRVLEFVQTACALALFGFIIFVSFKDTGDIFGGGKADKKGGGPEIRWFTKEERAKAAPGS